MCINRQLLLFQPQLKNNFAASFRGSASSLRRRLATRKLQMDCDILCTHCLLTLNNQTTKGDPPWSSTVSDLILLETTEQIQHFLLHNLCTKINQNGDHSGWGSFCLSGLFFNWQFVREHFGLVHKCSGCRSVCRYAFHMCVCTCVEGSESATAVKLKQMQLHVTEKINGLFPWNSNDVARPNN